MSDLRFAIRQLLKNPGFTAVAVLTLALGIGANATIFSIINSILIKPIQVPHPEQLVGLYQHDRENPGEFSLFSYPDFLDLRSAQDVAFTDLFAFRFSSIGLQGNLAEKLPACFVSANYFTALGVPPALGRVFGPEEEASGAVAAVLTYDFWKRLGADPAIIGRPIKLIGGSAIVVGVMPRGFTGAQVKAPAMFFPAGALSTLNPNPGQETSRILLERSDAGFMLMGRLKSGLTLANVAGALFSLNEHFPISDPAKPRLRTLICAAPSRFNSNPDPTNPAKSLAPIAGFASGLSLLVLLVACLNLANMMLARGAARRKEIAIRLALGAGRSRIMGQLLSEGLLLALLGGLAGLLVSLWATNLLTTFVYSGAGMPADFPKFDLSPDRRVMMMLLLVSGLAALVFALGPAWHLARLEVNSDLKRHASDAVHEGSGTRLFGRELLAIGQMAFALALLVAAALFTRSAVKIAQANPGFQFGSNFYVRIEPDLAGYAKSRARQFTLAAIERLSALPGVESASAALNIPFGDNRELRAVQRGGALPPYSAASGSAADMPFYATYNIVGARYFHTMGIPVLRGREFELRENQVATASPVAIISQTLADQLFPGQDALGRSIQFAGPKPITMTVVGVVSPVQWQLFEKSVPTQVYVPLSQDFSAMNLHVRVAQGVDPARVMKDSRNELSRLDPQVPVTALKSLSALHRDAPTLRIARLGSDLFGAFGGLALLLSVLGIYGLKAYAVARRTRELGIRMALGATRGRLIAMLLSESSRLAIFGLGLGLVLAFGVGQLSSSFLYQVSPFDWVAFGANPVLLLSAALIASLIPARRATRIDPMVALRYE